MTAYWFWRIGVAALFLFLFPQTVAALTVTPARTTVMAQPGDQAVLSLLVTNESSSSTVIVPEVDAFQIEPERGYPIFGADDPARWWVHAPSVAVTVAPGSSTIVAFIVDVPISAEPGEYHVGLFARERFGSGSGVYLGARGGSLVFLRVGAVDAYAETRVASRRRLAFLPNIFAVVSTKNAGKVQLLPEGRVRVLRREERIAELPLNPERQLLAAGGAWEGEFDFSALPLLLPARLSVEAVFEDPGGNELLRVSAPVWFVPWWSAFLALTLASILFFLAFFGRVRQL